MSISYDDNHYTTGTSYGYEDIIWILSDPWKMVGETSVKCWLIKNKTKIIDVNINPIFMRLIELKRII